MAKCKGKTIRGSRCSRQASPDSGFCYQHQSLDDPPAREKPRAGKLIGAVAATATAIAALSIGVDGLRKRKKSRRSSKKKRGSGRGKK